MRFYLVFTVIFMVMLAVSLVQARRQVGVAHHASLVLMCIGLVMSLLLASTRAMPDSWSLSLSRAMWWTGYGTFAVVSYLFLFQVCLLFAELGARLFARRFVPFFLSPRALCLAFALTFVVVAYGTYELDNLRVHSRQIVSAKVRQPVRLVAVTDLHLGVMSTEARLDALVALIRAQKPDLLLLVGDLVNDHPASLERLAAKFKAVEPRLGAFGVFGNHERYEGDGRSARVFEWAGARLLCNESFSLPEAGVQLLGVVDPGRAPDLPGVIAREIRSLEPELDPTLFRVLLNHRPLAWREAALPLGIELTLSGHTHKGQVFPFYLVVSTYHEFMGGFYEQGGQMLGVSAGAGFWGPPLRVLAPPDILVVDLLPAVAPGQ
ncbi:MAG: metallophosphoesterase [Desulfovibrio sp.]|jgi:predicted MPP superfamily phosphohydrolase